MVALSLCNNAVPFAALDRYLCSMPGQLVSSATGAALTPAYAYSKLTPFERAATGTNSGELMCATAFFLYNGYQLPVRTASAPTLPSVATLSHILRSLYAT